MASQSRSRFLIIFFVLYWFVFFFKGWYVLSYTKVWELSQMIGQERDEQLKVLHPTGEMASLIELKKLLRTRFADRKIAIEAPYRDQLLPQSHDTTILRSVLTDWPVLTNAFQADEYDLIVLIESTKSGQLTEAQSSADYMYCPAGEVCNCGSGVGVTAATDTASTTSQDKDILCWIMP